MSRAGGELFYRLPENAVTIAPAPAKNIRGPHHVDIVKNSPRLTRVKRIAQLESYEILGDGEGIHWPDIDEDLSVEGVLRGSH